MLNYLFLLPIFLIGLITSYQDFKYGKIKNKWIVLGLVWGIIIYISLVILKFFDPAVISYSYIFAVLINSGIALAVGYALWHFDLWSAGDAKLFFVFAFLLPLEYYGRGYLPYFPSFALLANVFIPAAAYLAFFNLLALIKIVPKANDFWRRIADYFKSNKREIFKISLGFFLVFAIVQIVRVEVGKSLAQMNGVWNAVILIVVLAGIKGLKGLFKKTKILVLLSLLIVLCFAVSVAGDGGGVKEFFPIIGNSLAFAAVFVATSAILAHEPAEARKTMPFAIWLFLGVIITMVIKKSLVSFFFF